MSEPAGLCMVDNTAKGQSKGEENKKHNAKTLNKHDRYPVERCDDIRLDLNAA
ncbi:MULTISPECIES: hypothetical protein [Phyllobacterium]|uniref:hypothetical protein n=1 Tax=Phyllobacterium TaxID=28100 RepID=UPI0013AF848F|nr:MULTISPECIES: hypothetical protein [Phyllobacterium]UXN63046.1 hypothetical protein N8E89_10145 [Phyllobacterium sp. A18/5-2]